MRSTASAAAAAGGPHAGPRAPYALSAAADTAGKWGRTYTAWKVPPIKGLLVIKLEGLSQNPE